MSFYSHPQTVTLNHNQYKFSQGHDARFGVSEGSIDFYRRRAASQLDYRTAGRRGGVWRLEDRMPLQCD